MAVRDPSRELFGVLQSHFLFNQRKEAKKRKDEKKRKTWLPFFSFFVCSFSYTLDWARTEPAKVVWSQQPSHRSPAAARTRSRMDSRPARRPRTRSWSGTGPKLLVGGFFLFFFCAFVIWLDHLVDCSGLPDWITASSPKSHFLFSATQSWYPSVLCSFVFICVFLLFFSSLLFRRRLCPRWSSAVSTRSSCLTDQQAWRCRRKWCLTTWRGISPCRFGWSTNTTPDRTNMSKSTFSAMRMIIVSCWLNWHFDFFASHVTFCFDCSTRLCFSDRNEPPPLFPLCAQLPTHFAAAQGVWRRRSQEFPPGRVSLETASGDFWLSDREILLSCFVFLYFLYNFWILADFE